MLGSTEDSGAILIIDLTSGTNTGTHTEDSTGINTSIIYEHYRHTRTLDTGLCAASTRKPSLPYDPWLV